MEVLVTMKLMNIIENNYDDLEFQSPRVSWEQWLSLSTKIRSECKKTIQLLKKGKVFLRGLGQKNDVDYFVSNKIVKRKPVDTPKFVDDYMESFRKKNYPTVPSRQQSIFCVLEPHKGFEMIRYGYGEIYVIFPSDDAKVFQSNIHGDLYYFAKNCDFETRLEEDGKEGRLIIDKHLDDYFSQANTTFNSLKVDKAEVVIETKKHYGLRVNPLGLHANRFFKLLL